MKSLSHSRRNRTWTLHPERWVPAMLRPWSKRVQHHCWCPCQLPLPVGKFSPCFASDSVSTIFNISYKTHRFLGWFGKLFWGNCIAYFCLETEEQTNKKTGSRRGSSVKAFEKKHEKEPKKYVSSLQTTFCRFFLSLHLRLLNFCRIIFQPY